MSRKRTVLALTATAAAAFAAPAAAQAEQTATADAQAGPLTMQLDARGQSGTMSGTLMGPGGNLIEVAGPVNCVDVQGDRVGLFVKMDSVEPEAMGAVVKGMSITLETDGQGNATHMGFAPSTVDSAPTCEPTVAPLPATGSATATE